MSAGFQGQNSENCSSSGQIALDLLLHEAASNGDEKKIEELHVYVKRGKLNVNQVDVEWGNRTALHCAAERGNAQCVKLLLEAGADPNAKMVGGWTPAHCAAEAGKVEHLQVLIDFRTVVNMVDDYGDTPRNIAEIYGRKDCVELLRKAEEIPVTSYSFKSKKFWNTVQSFTHEVQESVRKTGHEKNR